MAQRSCELQFAGSADVQLVEVRFTDYITLSERVTVRGKTAGAFRDAGTFQWTSAVRGLCILLLKTKLTQLSEGDPASGVIFGLKGSLAASLDYAITKQPIWIRDMLGTDASGSSMAHRLISRTNPNRKRPGPVVLRVNERAISGSDISVVWDNRRVESVEALRTLLLNLGDTGQAQISNGLRPGLPEKVAA
jgi:hypothetical protein